MTAKLKSILNATWKVSLGLFGLAVPGMGILIVDEAIVMDRNWHIVKQ